MVISVKYTSLHLNIKESANFKEFIASKGGSTSALLQAILMDYMLRMSFSDRKKKYTKEDLDFYHQTYGTPELTESIVYQESMKYINSKRFVNKYQDDLENLVNSVVIPSLACGVLGSITQEFSIENVKQSSTPMLA